ncbi:hypothetical protein EAI_04224, partial [Harpegnathos saltator]
GAIFPHRWIGRDGPVWWPPRSPYLNGFLSAFLKNAVFHQLPTMRHDMMHRIKNACRAIPANIFLKFVKSFKKRVQVCRAIDGGVFEHL